MGWYQKHRPKTLEEVLGQDHVTKPLQGMLKKGTVPQFLLFGGPSGVGKTTVARILKEELECSDIDFTEVNAATSGGIDFVRDLRKSIGLHSLGGKSRVWLVDESHAITTAAQQAMLKETEDVPKNVYFIFASSEPDKLIKALQTRATRFDFRSLAVDDQMELLRTVAAAENLDFEKKVLQEIVEAADGSARRAIVLLEQAAAAQDVNEQLVIVHRGNVKAQAISLCREMLSGSWSQAAKTLSHLDDDPEGVRRLILSYMTKTLLGGGKTTEKAARAIQCCQYNLFDSGKAGLVLAVYEFFNGN